MFMLFATLSHSIHHHNNRWLASMAIVLSATLVGNNPILRAENFDRLLSQSRVSRSPVANGVYLYGESIKPDLVGKEYIIFETIGNKTIGAFYLPRSEFNCFYGQFRGSRLDVTLIDGLDRQKYKFTLTLAPTGLTASKQPMMGEPTYQPLDKISNNDRRILATCKLQLQNK
jgi:hypothetical protein